MDSHKQLTLAFLTPGSDDHWVNRAAALTSRGYCHAELIFDSHTAPHTNKSLAFSVQTGESVRLKGKSFKNPRYEFVTLMVTPEEYDAALQFASTASQRNLTFSNLDMTLSLVHPGACTHRSSTAMGRSFCSKIIVEALQAAGCPEATLICPSSTTPGSLHAVVSESTRKISTCIKFRKDTYQLKIP